MFICADDGTETSLAIEDITACAPQESAVRRVRFSPDANAHSQLSVAAAEGADVAVCVGLGAPFEHWTRWAAELNGARDAIFGLQMAIIIVLPSDVLNALATAAPDFWSRRTFVAEQPPTSLESVAPSQRSAIPANTPVSTWRAEIFRRLNESTEAQELMEPPPNSGWGPLLSALRDQAGSLPPLTVLGAQTGVGASSLLTLLQESTAERVGTIRVSRPVGEPTDASSLVTGVLLAAADAASEAFSYLAPDLAADWRAWRKSVLVLPGTKVWAVADLVATMSGSSGGGQQPQSAMAAVRLLRAISASIAREGRKPLLIVDAPHWVQTRYSQWLSEVSWPDLDLPIIVTVPPSVVLGRSWPGAVTRLVYPFSGVGWVSDLGPRILESRGLTALRIERAALARLLEVSAGYPGWALRHARHSLLPRYDEDGTVGLQDVERALGGDRREMQMQLSRAARGVLASAQSYRLDGYAEWGPEARALLDGGFLIPGDASSTRIRPHPLA